MKSSPESAHEHDAPFHPTCPHCRYDLVTLPDGPCPECGTPFALAELRLFWLRRFHPNSDEALLADFKPICSQCRYDLAGLPEGRCPECGHRFTIRALQNLFIENKLRRRYLFSLELLLAVPTLLALVIWSNVLYETGAAPGAWFMGCATAAFCAAWIRLNRDQMLVRRPFYLLAIAVLTIPACLLSRPSLLWCGPLLPLPWIAGALLPWWFAPNRHRLVPVVLLTLALLPPGIIVLAEGARGWLHHEYWSNFDSILPARARYNWSDGSRPLTNPIPCLIGAGYTLIPIMAWIRTFWRRRKRPRAASTSAAHSRSLSRSIQRP